MSDMQFFDVDTNQTIRSAIVDFILSSCHFLEALYDPGFRWRTFLGGKPGTDIEASHASVATDSPIQPQVWVTNAFLLHFHSRITLKFRKKNVRTRTPRFPSIHVRLFLHFKKLKAEISHADKQLK